MDAKRLFCVRSNKNNRILMYRNDLKERIAYFSKKSDAKHARDMFQHIGKDCRVSPGPDHKRSKNV